MAQHVVERVFVGPVCAIAHVAEVRVVLAQASVENAHTNAAAVDTTGPCDLGMEELCRACQRVRDVIFLIFVERLQPPVPENNRLKSMGEQHTQLNKLR